MNKCRTFIMEYSLAIQRTELSSQEKICRKLKYTLLSEKKKNNLKRLHAI